MAVGNYVRVAIDNEKYHRDFVIAKVVKQNENVALVELIDNNALCDIYELPIKMEVSSSSLLRAKANIDSYVMYAEKQMIVLDIVEDDGFFLYLLTDEAEYYEAYENELDIEFNNLFVSPVHQYINYEFHNPVFYINRLKPNEIALRLKYSKNGFKELFGSRVYLMKHQMDTILKAQNSDNIRLMLADEVGLGKTIQALSILKSFMNKFSNSNVLILVPDHLRMQWKQELYSKFWLNVNDIQKDDGITLLSIEKYLNYDYNDSYEHYDFVIIDEIHNYISDSYFHKLEMLSLKSKNILLLSATPIQKRVLQFKRLVTLLDPERFKDLSINDFNELLHKQDKIRKIVYSIMRDLPQYTKDDFIQEDIDEEVETLVEILDDSILEYLHNELLNLDEVQERLLIIKRMLSYTSNYYQIERRVIRHRKSDLSNSFANRELVMSEIFYESNSTHYEDATLHAIEKYSKYLLGNKSDNFELVKDLYSAFTSSPYALESVVSSNETPYNDDLEELKAMLNLWKLEVDEQLNNVKVILDNPDTVNNRISHLVDYLDQNIYKDSNGNIVGEKVLLISNFPETIEKILYVLDEVFDYEIFTGFTEKMTSDEKDTATRKFQESNSCKILIADKTAGEGKNLQSADCIIHFDLSWSPADVEQRIGRLDRIGREANRVVKSIVFYKANCIEEDLIHLWNNTFNVYEKSISGLEIAISDVEEIIKTELISDLLDGIENASENVSRFVSDMYEYVEEERYYDMAKSLDPESEREYDEIFEQFSGNNEQNMIRSMQNWSAAIGLRASNVANKGMVFEYDRSDFVRNIGSLRKVLLSLPKTKLHLDHSKSNDVLRGTFDRDLAVKNESLAFFSPGESFFDTVFHNAKGNYKGRTSAVLLSKDFEWTGLKIDWLLNYDYMKLYKNGVGYKTLQKFKNLIKKPVISVKYDLEGTISKENYKEIIKEMTHASISEVHKKYCHIGSRSSHQAYQHPDRSDLEVFITRYPQKTWMKDFCKTVRVLEKKVNNVIGEYIDIQSAKNNIDETIIALENSKKYFGLSIEESEIDSLNLMKQLLEEDIPVKLSIDSIMYIEVMKHEV